MSRLRYARVGAHSPATRRPPIPQDSSSPGMGVQRDLVIRVSAGNGIGPTRMAAFDHALRSAGVADFNLVRLSSVIPPGADVRSTTAHEQIRGGHGDMLYCVYADAYASTPGEQAWAGVAWSLREDGSGAGLFVEHSGSSRHTVERDLAASLEAMALGRLHHYARHDQLMASAQCIDHPVCAVVIATYGRSDWNFLQEWR